eukprot:1554047-Rhodomonas_salina.1
MKEVPGNAKRHVKDHEFELDFCLKVKEEVRLRDLFDVCCEEQDVAAFLPRAGGSFEVRTGFENATTGNSTYVHFEITRLPSKAVEKMLQLERARALEKACLPAEWGAVSAIGVFINGDQD